jgi:hypothetical protein
VAVEVIEIKDANGVTQRVYTDKIGTDNVQVIKPGFGADDTITLVSATNGLPVSVVSGATSGTEYTEGATDTTITGQVVMWEDAGDTIRAVSVTKPMPVTVATGSVPLAAGEFHVGQVGGATAAVTPPITVSTAIYAAGDVIGGRLTLTNAVRITSGTGILQDISMTTADAEALACRILIFDSQPATNPTDNNAFTWGSGDRARLLGVVDVASGDWITVAGTGICHKQQIGMVIAANGSLNLFAFIVATATPQFTAVSDLSVRFKFLQD